MTEPLVHAHVSLSRLQALWMIPIALAVHNAEEAITFPAHLVVAAVVMRGYSPGLVSAVLINAPVSVYLFHRAARERWLPRTAWRALWPAALLVHGPGLVGLLLLARVGP